MELKLSADKNLLQTLDKLAEAMRALDKRCGRRARAGGTGATYQAQTKSMYYS